MRRAAQTRRTRVSRANSGDRACGSGVQLAAHVGEALRDQRPAPPRPAMRSRRMASETWIAASAAAARTSAVGLRLGLGDLRLGGRGAALDEVLHALLGLVGGALGLLACAAAMISCASRSASPRRCLVLGRAPAPPPRAAASPRRARPGCACRARRALRDLPQRADLPHDREEDRRTRPRPRIPLRRASAVLRLAG